MDPPSASAPPVVLAVTDPALRDEALASLTAAGWAPRACDTPDEVREA